jgi:hypothetical protein
MHVLYVFSCIDVRLLLIIFVVNLILSNTQAYIAAVYIYTYIYNRRIKMGQQNAIVICMSRFDRSRPGLLSNTQAYIAAVICMMQLYGVT